MNLTSDEALVGVALNRRKGKLKMERDALLSCNQCESDSRKGLTICSYCGNYLMNKRPAEEVGSAFNDRPDRSIALLIVSLAVFLYFFFIVLPFGSGFYSNAPSQREVTVYLMLSVPVCVAYFLFILLNYTKFLYLNTLNYPLVVINIYSFILAYMFLVPSRGGPDPLVFLAIICLFLMLPASFIAGLLMDLIYLWQKRKATRK